MVEFMGRWKTEWLDGWMDGGIVSWLDGYVDERMTQMRGRMY
jgi:hypothetical protein